MSIFEQQGDLESFSDDMLVREAQQPTGRYPQFLVITEMQRRKDLRQRAQAQAYEQQPTVAEKLVQETGSLGGPGIPGVDTGPRPTPTPGMQQGIAKFANGGMVQGYQHGGPHPNDPWYKRAWDRTGLMGPWEKGYGARIEEVTGVPGASLWDRYHEDPLWATRDILKMMGYESEMPELKLGPDNGDPFPDRPPHERYYGPNRPRMPDGIERGPIDVPLDPEQSGFDSGLLDRVRGYYGESMDVGALLDILEGAEARGEDLTKTLDSLGKEDRARLESMAAMLGEYVQEDPTSLEQELMAMRRSPEDRKRERTALALSGLGSLIGAGTRRDIAAGMAPLAREAIATGQEQRAEDRSLVTDIGRLEQARRDRNVALKMQQFQAEGMAVDAARSAALKSEEIESNLDQMAMGVRNLERQGKMGLAEALTGADRMLTEIAGALARDELARGLTPGAMTSAMNAIAGMIAKAEELAQFDPTKAQEVQRLRNMFNYYAGEYARMVSQQTGAPMPDLDAGTTLGMGGFEIVDPRSGR